MTRSPTAPGQRPRKLSIADVALRASVSVATASRVLSGSSYPVRADTRRRVLQAAEELDYRPSLVARALATNRTSTLAAIVHDISDPYFGEIVRGLEDRARASGYQVFVCSSDRDADRELDYVRNLISRHVDGLIFAGGGIAERPYERRLDELLTGYAREGGAVVVLSPHSYDGLYVRPDNRAGARLMTTHLIERGHREIAFIQGPPQLRTSTARQAGYEAALRSMGLESSEDLRAAGDFTVGGGATAARIVMERRPDVTAIFAGNDVMAIGALAELDRLGVEVPGDVSVAGFDDIQLARYASPPLTTIRLPMYDMGYKGAGLAIDASTGGNPDSVDLDVTLVERGSTGPARR